MFTNGLHSIKRYKRK